MRGEHAAGLCGKSRCLCGQGLGEVICFDHVSAEIIRTCSDELVVELRNDTPYDAVVTVFAENARQQKRPMKINPWDSYQKVRVPSHGSTEIHFDR